MLERLLGAALLGDIDMGGDPAAVGHWLMTNGVDAAVRQFVLGAVDMALCDLPKPHIDIFRRFYRPRAGTLARFQNRPQGCAALQLFGTEAVHLAITRVADHQTLIAIEHA